MVNLWDVKWVQVYSRRGKDGDRIAGTVWEQMGQNCDVFARENGQ